MLQNGVSHRSACVKLSTKGGVSHHFGEVLTSLKNYRSDMGYRSDSIAVSRDMGPLRNWKTEGAERRKAGVLAFLRVKRYKLDRHHFPKLYQACNPRALTSKMLMSHQPCCSAQLRAEKNSHRVLVSNAGVALCVTLSAFEGTSFSK